MQKNFYEVKNSNRKPCIARTAKLSLEFRGNEFINGTVNDLSREFKAYLCYKLHEFLDYLFDTSN